MDGEQKAKHQPGGMMTGGGEMRARPLRWTQSSVVDGISWLLLSSRFNSLTQHISKLMRCRARPEPARTLASFSPLLFVGEIFPPHTGERPVPRYSLCNNRMLSVSSSSRFIHTFFSPPSVSLTPHDVITLTDVSLQSSYDESMQRAPRPRR